MYSPNLTITQSAFKGSSLVESHLGSVNIQLKNYITLLRSPSLASSLGMSKLVNLRKGKYVT